MWLRRLPESVTQWGKPVRNGVRELELGKGGQPWLQIVVLPDEQARRSGFTLARHAAQYLTGAKR